MNVLDILTDARRRYAHHPALVMRVGYRTVTLTYEQVYTLSHQTAAFLAANGVGKGDCVAVCAPNSPYWICLFWGCMLRGAVVVPLNTQSTPEMIAKIIKQTEAKLFFTLQKVSALREVQEGEPAPDFDPGACNTSFSFACGPFSCPSASCCFW